jgi:hypothetical protein
MRRGAIAVAIDYVHENQWCGGGSTLSEQGKKSVKVGIKAPLETYAFWTSLTFSPALLNDQIQKDQHLLKGSQQWNLAPDS